MGGRFDEAADEGALVAALAAADEDVVVAVSLFVAMTPDIQ
jgi:hypothetical protein